MTTLYSEPEHTRRVDLVPQEVHWICGRDGCQGEMLWTSGFVFSTNPPIYQHTCDSCGQKSEMRGHSYPRIEYRKV